MSESEFELYLQLLGKFLKLRPGQRVEIADELRDHLEARLEELSRAGMPRSDAVRRALDEFGDAACLADHFSQLARERKKRFLMRCTLGTVSVAAVVLIVVTSLMPEPARMPIGGAPSTVWAKPGADEKTVAVVDLDEALNQKLDEARLTLAFSETPGREAVELLREKLAIDIVTRGDVMPQLDQPVNLTVKHSELSGRAALQLVLEQLELSYVIRDGLIHIRPPHDSLAMATIDLGSMLQSDDPNDDADAAGEQLVATIQRLVQPNGWDTAGGPGTIAVFKGLIIVRHTPDVIGEVNRFLDVLRLDLERRSAANSRR